MNVDIHAADVDAVRVGRRAVAATAVHVGEDGHVRDLDVLTPHRDVKARRVDERDVVNLRKCTTAESKNQTSQPCFSR